MKIVHIDSSIAGHEGTSSILAKSVVDKLVSGQNTQVHYRDLNQENFGHLTDEIFSGFRLEAAERNDVQQAAAKRSEIYIEELRDADVLVLAAPMYNFSTPSTVKAWIDHVARAGISFAYRENGPVGLLNVKKAYVVSTRGGQYAGSGFDHMSPWIEQVLKFVGIQDVEFIYAEGMAGGNAEQSVQVANQQIAELS
ncbi:MAG: NAD(P)H-dependent oxidoreductase [Oleispira antarctica]|uniref:FMN dependent NADH:quinone oxidoreductase n=1 Tax=Oleispira antarctica RB-8 TaxID=698738 RepID=R4YKG3_OLEAN|nr:NAD(P)H-dependent oxidoreductase [Oleispira antarctica]MBQ0791679.1 NAD(P)H-dependent oxidoreductase [Oleispira antarctica]CCK75006.1 FMN-dependent NADH-azoreductase 2 [Oleispira antarctica RB-8]